MHHLQNEHWPFNHSITIYNICVYLSKWAFRSEKWSCRGHLFHLLMKIRKSIATPCRINPSINRPIGKLLIAAKKATNQNPQFREFVMIENMWKSYSKNWKRWILSTPDIKENWFCILAAKLNYSGSLCFLHFNSCPIMPCLLRNVIMGFVLLSQFSLWFTAIITKPTLIFNTTHSTFRTTKY